MLQVTGDLCRSEGSLDDTIDLCVMGVVTPAVVTVEATGSHAVNFNSTLLAVVGRREAGQHIT